MLRFCKVSVPGFRFQRLSSGSANRDLSLDLNLAGSHYVTNVGLATYRLKRGKRDDECAEYRKFGFQTSCVSDLYRRCLPKLVTKETAKVLIDVADEDGWGNPSQIQRSLSVTISPLRASLAEYWPRDEFGRKQFALETLHAGLMWLANVEGWPTESLEAAYRSSLQCGLVNEFYGKKTYPNPSKTASIKLFCEFGVYDARYYAVVMQRRKELERVFLGATVPESYIVWMTQQSFAWISDQAVQIQIVHPDFGGPTVHDLSSVLSSVS